MNDRRFLFPVVVSIVLQCMMLGTSNVFAATQELNIQRLTWAGIKLTTVDTTVFVDAVGTDIWNGEAPDKFMPLTADTRRRYAVVTHVHNDHFDANALKAVLGEKGYVICHQSIATYIASRGLKVIPVETYEPVSRGGFMFTPVPANDGFGETQFSWIITGFNKRIIHAGDTLWHGIWQTLGEQYGPFDVAFLPINGVVVAGEHTLTSAAVMSPSQAADAAILLNANLIVPIHYGVVDDKNYKEVPKPVAQLITATEPRKQRVQTLGVGDFVDWDN